MEKLTTEQRHRVYKKVLAELQICRKNKELFFICTALRDTVCPGATDIPAVIKALGFDELFKHKPPYASYAWFGGLEYEPRIKILESLIAETAA